jgi:DNA-binding MarR family transcriptional regulator
MTRSSTAHGAEAKRVLAGAAWRALVELVARTGPQRDRVLERHGLTPNDARALRALDAEQGKAMRALADEWGTDASNATWVIDRLERKGLARRTERPGDRRVRLVVLTTRGVRVRAEILRAVHEPPSALLALDRRDLAALRSIVARLASDAPRKARD